MQVATHLTVSQKDTACVKGAMKWKTTECMQHVLLLEGAFSIACVGSCSLCTEWECGREEQRFGSVWNAYIIVSESLCAAIGAFMFCNCVFT